jgi:adenylate kinase
MDTQTIILLGPQGSGKGTQSEKLANHLQSESKKDVLHFETGQSFRQLARQDNWTGKQIRSTIEDGKLQPSFLAVRLWATQLIDNLDPETHLVLDGSPRRMLEAKLLSEALDFYQRGNRLVIHLTIDEETTYERLSDRGRNDDTQEAIAIRLAQYRKQTKPVIDHFKEIDNYRCEEVDGKQSIAAVHDDICNLLS